MSLDELKKEIPGIDWDAFLNGIGVKGVTELSVSQVDPIKEVEKIINSLPVEKSDRLYAMESDRQGCRLLE